jgi:glycosyltransferase involved in cell wall biosynthesis
MATHDQLLKLYDDLLPDNHDGRIQLCVVPLIRHNYKESDYLYLLYRDIIENRSDQFNLQSISVWKHWVFVRRAVTSKNVILHYHWLECTDLKSLAGMIYKLICIFLFKAAGGHLVWTIHNKMPHDDNFRQLNYRIQSWMASRADLLHIHCKSAVDDISRFYNQPASKFRVINHPTFPSKKIKRDDAIEKVNGERNLSLKKSDRIFLMFGNISSYKQIDKVCRMFIELPPDKKLLIVGPVKKGQMSNFYDIKEISNSSINILLVPHFIPEEMVPHYMNSADCVLFNYHQILTSGGVELARSYGRPILAPNMGCLAELNEGNATLFNSQEQLMQLLASFEPKVKSDA